MSGRISKLLTLLVVVSTFLPQILRAEIVINEIMYNPVGADGSRDWLELYNNGTDPVTLVGGTSSTNGWRIYQENSTGTVSNRTLGTTAFQGTLTLNAGEYAIVVVDGAAFKTDYPSFSGNIFTAGSMSLTSTASQKVGLRIGSSGTPWSVVTYSSDQGANDDGNSLQLQSDNTWAATTPTPGLVNAIATSGTSTSTSTTTGQTSGSATTTSTTSTTSSTTHVYYSSSALSFVPSKPTIELSAGRDRLATTGSPLEFKVETNVAYTRTGEFKWNFGDGTEALGDQLTHTYYYPGKYVVMLNAHLPSGVAVAQARVRVVDPSVAIRSADTERIEIENKSEEEVSLFGRVLWAGGKAFVFPQDTIILPQQTISFSSRITGLTPTNTNEVQFLVVGEVEQPKIQEKIKALKEERITELQSKISFLQTQLVALRSAPSPNPSPTEEKSAEPPPPSSGEVTVLDEQTAASLNAPVVRAGWLGTLKSFFLGEK